MELPSLSKSLLPILFPLFLILANTVASVMVPETPVANFFAFIGSPLAACLQGFILSCFSRARNGRAKNVNDWVNEGIVAAAVLNCYLPVWGRRPEQPFVKNAGVAEKIASYHHRAFSFPAILITHHHARPSSMVTGSNALGVMTAAALVEPMLATLGISPIAAPSWPVERAP